MNPSEACKYLSERPSAIASLLLFVALREARRYKWEESKRLGHDVGQDAVIEWFKKNWPSWYRNHWVAHVCGSEFWEEFGQQDFGLAHRPYPNAILLKDIIDHVSNHGENLGIILWATDSKQDMAKVLEILRMMDINGKRAEMDEAMICLLANAMDEAEKYKWVESERAGKDLGDEAIFEWFRTHWGAWYGQITRHAS